MVFDLDGVLIDSERSWDAARRAVVQARGGHWSEDATLAMMGMSAPEWSRYMRTALGVPLTDAEIDSEVVQRLLAGYARELPVIPGAARAVTELEAVWPLGLASSSNREVIDRVLDLLQLRACFRAVVSTEDVARGKPAPDVYLAVTRALGVDPRLTVAIEDSSNGLRSAAAAGLVVLAIPNRQFPPDTDALALAADSIASIETLSPALVSQAFPTARPSAPGSGAPASA